MRTCPSCGVTWDQDDNAAKNLLAGHLARRATASAAGAGSSELKEGRWAKAKRMSAEKKARKEATI